MCVMIKINAQGPYSIGKQLHHKTGFVRQKQWRHQGGGGVKREVQEGHSPPSEDLPPLVPSPLKKKNAKKSAIFGNFFGFLPPPETHFVP